MGVEVFENEDEGCIVGGKGRVEVFDEGWEVFVFFEDVFFFFVDYYFEVVEWGKNYGYYEWFGNVEFLFDK